MCLRKVSVGFLEMLVFEIDVRVSPQGILAEVDLEFILLGCLLGKLDLL